MRGRLRLYCNPMKNNIGTFKVKGVTFEMVKVDGGSYQMGSHAGASDEQPVHTETVNTFYIGKTVVTQRLWWAVNQRCSVQQQGTPLP